MKKILRYVLLLVMLICIIGITFKAFIGYRADKRQKENRSSQIKAPSRIAQAGPYGTNIRSSYQVDGISFNLSASKLCIKKTKLFGFSNALLKKMVARDLKVTIAKGGKQTEEWLLD